MEQMEIPERFKKMSIEEIMKEINGSLEKRKLLEMETRKMAIEALRMERKSNERLTKELEAANKESLRLLKEKGTEHRRFMEVIEQTNDKVYDIGMEIAKRIEALENLKRLKDRTGEGNEEENVAIDFAIDELQALLQFIQYRLIPIPVSKEV